MEKSLAPLAQLDRVFDYESKGWEFESPVTHQRRRNCSLRAAAPFIFIFCSFMRAAPDRIIPSRTGSVQSLLCNRDPHLEFPRINGLF